MNTDSLCAKCKHLKCSNSAYVDICNNCNLGKGTLPVVFIDKGFKTCINFEPKKEQK